MDLKNTKGSQRPIVYAPSEEYPEVGLLDRIKQSKFGKTILGENSSFDRKYAERLARRAKDAVINAAESIIEVKKQTYTGAHENAQAAKESTELQVMKKGTRRNVCQEETAPQDNSGQILPDLLEEVKELLKQD